MPSKLYYFLVENVDRQTDKLLKLNPNTNNVLKYLPMTVVMCSYVLVGDVVKRRQVITRSGAA